MKKKISIITLITTATILLSIFYYLSSWNVSIDSDSSTVVLQAQSILKSNFLLEGWTLSTGTYYTTDLIFYVLAILMFGFSTKVIYIVTAVQYALMVIIASAIAGRNSEKSFSWFKSFLAFFVLCIPSLLMSNLIFSGPMHIGGMIYALIALYSLLYMKGKNKWILYSFFLTLALIGDTLILWIFVLPIVIVCFLRILVKDNRKNELFIIGVTLASYVFQSLIQMLLKSKEVNAMGMVFATYDQILINIKLTIEGLLGLFGADFFGKTFTSIDTVKIILHLFIMIFIFFITYKKIKVGFIKSDRLTQVLIIAIILNVLEYLFSNLPVNMNTTRYLIPMFIYSSILFAKNAYDYNLVKKNKKVTVLILVIILLISIPTLKYGRIETTHDRLAGFLEEKNLKSGYGSYFNASTVTLRSEGRVAIRPVITAGVSYSRFDWLSDIEWYNDYANFLVFDQTNWGDVNLKSAVEAFGEPATSYEFEGLNILVWNKDLSKEIIK